MKNKKKPRKTLTIFVIYDLSLTRSTKIQLFGKLSRRRSLRQSSFSPCVKEFLKLDEVKRINKNRVQQHFKSQVDRSVTGKAYARASSSFTQGDLRPCINLEERGLSGCVPLRDRRTCVRTRVWPGWDLHGQRRRSPRETGDPWRKGQRCDVGGESTWNIQCSM